MIKTHLLALSLFAGPAFSQQVISSKAPNSYIFDLDLANAKNYAGLDIPVKKAYAMWSSYEYLKSGTSYNPIPGGAQSASLYWEDVPGLIRDVKVVQGSQPSDASIKVTVNRAKGKGNAVIAFKVNGTIYWSWHVWVTDNPEKGVEYSQSFETDIDGNPIKVQYMDRNLGASSSSFLGNDWQKSGGLLYEWGRKDPFPPLEYKDKSFYSVTGEVGQLKHRSLDKDHSVPIRIREYDEIEKNIHFSVKNPITFIVNTDSGNWFSKERYKVNGQGVSFVTWDLWSDNAKGANSNGSSSNVTLSKESRSYELKSEMDPCPDGWRVPSYYGRVTMNNNLSPWGRKNSGANDDVSANSTLSPDQKNDMLDGVKVYPGLGIDFTNAQNGDRNLGMMPITGNYEYYPNAVSPNASVYSIYQDENSDGGLWSATYGYDGVRALGLISDPARSDASSAGKHGVYINQTVPTKEGLAVRCMRDPNIAKIGSFPTQYFKESKQDFKAGLQAPNTYLAVGQSSLEIPVSKAFAVYNQLLTDREDLRSDHLVAKVLWTDNPLYIKTIEVVNDAGDARKSRIKLAMDASQKGNAVISLHNLSTETPAYWSWHIWNPSEDPTLAANKYTTEAEKPAAYNIVKPTQSLAPQLTTVFMDRNLGAVERLGSAQTNDEAFKSFGFQYQWGRKDPLPNFTNANTATRTKYFLGNENASETHKLSYTEFDENYYEYNKTISYSSYGSRKIVTDDAVDENILFSVQRPLVFLYQPGIGRDYDGGNKRNNDLQNIKDWVYAGKNVSAERWGHAARKSVYDPCPQGWRVPDVSTTILYSGSKGNSPWYNGYKNDAYGKPGVIQDQWHDAATYYGAQKMGTSGYSFSSDQYAIGDYPFAGIRGEVGENKNNGSHSGVWTAALADLDTGYALAMLFNNTKMQTGTGVYPQAAMSVRCAKDDTRLLGAPQEYDAEEVPVEVPPKPASPSGVAVVKNSSTLIYPNPVGYHFYIKSDNAESYEVYGMGGRLRISGKIINRQGDVRSLLPGNYVVKIKMKDGSRASQIIMKD